MSKKGKKRVLNRKLKRTIRYTFATLCMITAITVAAIPAPKNEAAYPLSRSLPADTRDLNYDYSIEDTRTGNPPGSDSPTDGYFKQINNSYNLNKYLRADAGSETGQKDDINTFKKAYAVLKIDDTTYSLNWQYKYYEINDGIVLCQYNDRFSQKNIEIGNSLPTKYYTIECTEFNDFFATDSNSTITIKTDDYLANLSTITQNVQKLEKYANETYSTWKNSVDKYSNLTQEEKDNTTKPSDLVVDLRTIDLELRKQYYCEYVAKTDSNSYFTDFTLIKCDDYSSGTLRDVYLIKKINDEAPTDIDVDLQGFACSGKASKYVIAIGDYAFQNVTNVEVLKMTDQMKAIGDYAFVNSFIKSVSLGNVQNIGNGAFKNTSLESVDLNGVVTIGAETFSNNVSLQNVQFTQYIKEIGAGAFAGCTRLQSIDLTPIADNCIVGDYAFYNCVSLNSISLPDGKIKTMESIGKAAFAVPSNSDLYEISVVLPNNLTELPDYLFAGRAKLQSVVFPDRYGAYSDVTLPKNMFIGCAGLRYVEFPETCVNVKFGDSDFCYEFFDVQTDDFYVTGPGYEQDGHTIASPREETWRQVTIVHDFVPYKYMVNGQPYYEVKQDGFILNADETTNELLTCTPVGGVDHKLTIPNYVGNIKIDGLASGCITNDIKNVVEEIIIEDDSIISIDSSTFEDCPNLTQVTIGDSVSSIGSNAFKNCKKLENVTFHTPSAGYGGFSIGTDAFTTGSEKLTFHGDIVEGYMPFDWAMDPDNYMNKSSGVRVCYESLSPTYLKVMYDGNQESITLINYPKYKNIDEEHQDAIGEKQDEYYEKYKSSEYDEERLAFRDSWAKFMYDKSGMPSNDEIKAFYKDAEEQNIYGPWINEEFVNPSDATYSSITESWDYSVICSAIGYTGSGGSARFLFSPTMRVMAAGGQPEAYFDTYPYSILDNYENPDMLKEWKRDLNSEELGWIEACLSIDVPEAVESIDISSFLRDEKRVNSGNIARYLNTLSEDYKMYWESNTSGNIVGGLFSGYYEDSTNDRTCSSETEEKGNDYVYQITLHGITSLPDYAFDSCENLDTVYIGSKCTEMGKAPFRGCTSLASVGGNDVFFCENGIVYERMNNDELKIKECLASRGGEKLVDQVISLVKDPNLAKVTSIEAGAFQDCDMITGVDFSEIASATSSSLKEIPDEAFRNCDLLSTAILPESVDSIQDYAFAEDSPLTVTIPGKEVFISTTAFDHKSNVTLRSYEGSAAQEYANYYKPMQYENISDSYRVVFLDHDGTQIGETQYIEDGKNATPPADPVRSGYTFTGWSGSYNGITQDTILVAQYQAEGSGSGGSGGSGSGSGGSGGSESGGSSSSDGKYVLTVIGGTGSGSYAAGTNIIISANTPPKGKTFYNWTMSTTMSIVSSRSAATTVTMPASNATVTANYIDSGSSYLTVSTNEVQPLKKNTVSGNTTTNNKTNNVVTKTDGTKVSITKPGISNRDLAAAKVNGSTDNFIVKISESALATEEVQKALLAKYGSLDSIRYVAMDISLYDSTGTTQITDTTGLTVDVTIPIPDEMIAYAGNNKAGAVSNGVLEDLTPKFTTIDGVACVTFRATHFSPYTIYVDVNNMSSGNLDETPKTGDGIAPKWVLSIGLAAISILLFMKKEKAPVRKKTA